MNEINGDGEVAYRSIDIVVCITSPHALISHRNHTTSVYWSLNYFVQRTFNNLINTMYVRFKDKIRTIYVRSSSAKNVAVVSKEILASGNKNSSLKTLNTALQYCNSYLQQSSTAYSDI